MKTSELRLLSDQEVETKLTDTRNELMNLRFQIVMGQQIDTSRLKATRRQIAQFETIISERRIAGMVGEA